MITSLSYLFRLLCALGWNVRLPARRVVGLSVIGAAMIGAAAAYGGEARAVKRGTAAESLTERAAVMAGLLEQVEAVYSEEVAPLERVLLGYRSDDPQLVRRIAVTLLREARRTDLEPRLLLAVLLVENPWLDPEARSFVGAQGLMQVMPLHLGKWAPCPPRLDDVESNICHGASIFAAYLKQEKGNVDRALLRYNGCVRGTNTPTCHQYPNHVYARAGRASVLAWRNAGTMGAAP
ncbi:hypothetical protein BH23GEM9_BH23GEM9_00810 [soil metagenome]